MQLSLKRTFVSSLLRQDLRWSKNSKVIMRWLILIFLPSAAAYSPLTITASPKTGEQISPAASTVLTTTVSRTIGSLTPSAPPANVRGSRMSSTSIFVQWDQVPSQYQNGVILYYTVAFYRRYYSSSFPQRVVVAAPTTQTTLTGLNQGALYSISVSASNIRGDGPVASISIATGCARELEIHNGTNGEIIFYRYYRYYQICSWKIMANKGEQVKLVLKSVNFPWCSFSCSCGQLEIQNGTYADGSAITRMCSTLRGKVTIYSHVGHGLRIRARVTHSLSRLAFKASYTVISSKNTVSDECFNYTFLNESNRAVTNVSSSLGNLSDFKLSGWYRFSGGAGTQMAEACPKMYSCSTNSSGWLNGSHPTVAEGIVKRKVCFLQLVSQFLTDCCNQAKTISVRNCGGFYVYRLDPSDYYSRYCGNGLSQAPECSNYEFLTDCSRAVTYRSVLANCNNAKKLLGWYRFGGEAGTQMADTCVSMRHCGARYPGWLSGGHPSVSDGAVLRKVCFTGNRGCCQYSTFISVRNCNGFYIYKLSTVVQYYYRCYYRYCSSYGSGQPTTSTTGSSAPPANVSGYNTSSTSIFVQWDQVPAAHQNGAMLYYTVTYRALPSGLRQTVVVAAPGHHTRLTGLNKYTNYSITLFASTCKDGNVSAPIFIVTDEDTPSAPPANVRGNSTSTSIFVQWDQVPPQYQNGVILYYTVTYYRAHYGGFRQRVVVFAPTTQTTLTGLNHRTLYSISVSASTIKGDGYYSQIYIATGCVREQEIHNGTNGEIIFQHFYYYYRYNQTCIWKIMANKGEQVKLVLKIVDFPWCGFSCSCGQLEIQNGIYADGSAITRMCSILQGKVTIYSHVGHDLRIRVVTHSSRGGYFRASYTVISSKDPLSDECSKYTSLNESNRAMTYAKRSLAGLSDAKLSGWYRFNGGAGTQMAEACPKMYSCSTNSSGWLNGTHPTVAEGIVQRNVCFLQRASQFFHDCCNRSKNIRVRNCGAFYVYRLDPPDYYSRYCSNGLPQAPECSNYKFLNDSSRAVTYNRRVLMKCNDTTKLLGWYRFGGEAGTQMADTCVQRRHCGAWYPGWLSGGHPSVSDGAVLRKVCFTGYRGCCQYSTFISVRNCYGFYIYKLSPVVQYYYRCYYRYCSSYGSGQPTTSITGPSAPPANVSGHNTSSSSIFVQWDQVPAAHQNGAILYYTVTYRALPSGSVQTNNVTAPANQTTLTGLNKYTNYSITVFASTCKGAGNVSAPFFIVTDEDRPSGYPVNVRGNTISSTSIFVQWDEVPAARQNGVILYYTITYRPYSVFCLVNVFAPKTQITLTGLNESTIYRISVSASTIKGHGPARHISIATACARQQKILNARNGKIIFSSYYYRYNQTCSWKIVANKREQVKLVLESVHFRWCGLSCSCSHLEIQDGTFADGFTTTRICSHLLGNTIIYSHVGHGLRIQAVTHASWWNSFRASYTVISHKDNVSDECSNYKFLNDSNRAVKYVNKNLDNLSDIKLSGWYRFSGGAGVQMADTCPRMYSCSTNSSGWLSGTHPTVAEGIVQRKVCFSQRASQFFNDCCYHSKNISVRNCGAFYVYRLDPPDYYSRYCGNGLPQAPECSNYKLLDDFNRVATYNQSVLANCNDTTKLIGWYRFGGEAGTQMADTCVKMRHCGAWYPGWLSGGHPSLSDGAVLRKVCFTRYRGCCHYSTFISVRNCSGFYVYKLSPVYPYNSCEFRYCSTNGFELPTTSTTVPAAASTILTTTVSSTAGPQRPSAPPANVSGYNTSSISVFVQWDQVPAAILYYTVTYRALPSGSVQRKTVTAPANQTTLTGLNKYTNYSIVVFASTCKGAGNISAPIFIVTDEDTPSASPANVTGNSTSSTSILVKWDHVPLPYQNGVILYYTVTYRLYYNGLFPQTVVVAAPTNQTTLTGLNQSTLYSIAVSASTSKGGGPFTYIYVATVPAAASTILTTTVSSTAGPQRPRAPPANVSGYNTSSTSVFVQWDQVPAAILYYTVTYRALPSGSVQRKTVTAPANQTTLTGLKKYTNYSIVVFASTCKGAGNISAPIFVVTDEDTPSASPANVTGKSTSSTSILVKWDQVPLPYQNGVILYYTVTYRLYYNGLFPQTVVVAAPTNQTTLTGLNQSTLYSIAVSASTSKGGGPFTYIYVATAKNSTTAITKKTTEPTTCKSIDLFILDVFSSFVANLSIYSNEDVVPILTKYDSTLYNFGVEITQKKLDYDHTNTILVSALCNYIPM
ncbi:PREDICTED: uncharacterized protein LOC107347066 isoform X3 [Acropora digitifera]|uniref:uncharacterized protein LOC107347066 isoform X3 n=1 Tax=Acropora digitifera TaxID=70779 RepID=UPI000779F58E|nr:PREDICTED: uncharacterized protein LOC107347066 isoform X3 [Acropora digitifera]